VSNRTFIMIAIAAAVLAAVAFPALAQQRLRPPATANERVSPAPDKVSEAEVRSTLQAEGYTEVDILQLEGATYDVQARKDGQNYVLEVDVLTGKIKSRVRG
jgi:hypothetical protein